MNIEPFYQFTNIYALEEEENTLGFYERMRPYWEKIHKEIEDAVIKHDVDKLLAISHDAFFISRCRSTSEFAEFIMAMEVYDEEVLYAETYTVLDQVDELSEIIEKLTEVKFALLRIEFCEGEEAYSHLLGVIERYQISATFVKMMLRYVNRDKTAVALRLSRCFIDAKLLRHAQAVLEEAKREDDKKNKESR